MSAIAQDGGTAPLRGPPPFQRRAVWYFAALAGASVVAFWRTYLTAPPLGHDFAPVHLHGLAMFGWFALLLAQAGLASTGHLCAHRWLGLLGWLLVPAIVASTLWLAHVHANDRPTAPDTIWFLYVQLSLLAFFTLCFAWAMASRRRPMLHMRYIAGTAFAAVDPIFARILYFNLDIEPPLLQLITYGAVAVGMAWLWSRDRERRPCAAAWRRMLAAYVLLVAPVFFVAQTAGWRAFVAWFAGV